MRKFLLFGFLCLLQVGLVQAQERTVTGKVTSAEDGNPLPGVNVVVKGTASGTVTDVAGEYKVNVPAGGATLVFSFIGLLSQEITAGERTVIDVQLGTDAKQLGEVVVTAAGIEREKEIARLSCRERYGIKGATGF